MMLICVNIISSDFAIYVFCFYVIGKLPDRSIVNITDRRNIVSYSTIFCQYNCNVPVTLFMIFRLVSKDVTETYNKVLLNGVPKNYFFLPHIVSETILKN